MKTRWQNFRKLVRRELSFLIKDIDILTIILLSPLFYGLFYGTVYLNKVEREIPVIVVDQDNSTLSRQLIRSLDASPMLQIVETTTNLQHSREAIEMRQVQGVVWIPEDFSPALKKGRQAHLKVYLNNSRFLPSNDINRAVQQTVAIFNGAIRLHYFEAKGLNKEQALSQIQPLNVDNRNLFNPRQSYGDFLIPGVLTLILQQTLLFGLAMSVAREFENRSFAELLNLAHGRFLPMAVGKGFFYFVLYFAYSLLFFSLYLQLLHLPFKGNYLSFQMLNLIFLLTITIWAVIIGSFFRSKLTALQVLVFSSYPLFLLSGFSWPLQAMPWWLRGLSHLLPSTPYFLAMQRMVTMGAGLSDVLLEMIHLIILLLLGIPIGIWRFKVLQKVPVTAQLSELH